MRGIGGISPVRRGYDGLDHLSEAIRKILIPSDKWSGEVMMYNLDVVIAVDVNEDDDWAAELLG